MPLQVQGSSHNYKRPETSVLLAVIIVTGAAIAPHGAHVPLWISGFSIIALVLRYAAVVGKLVLPWRILLIFGVCASAGGVFLQYGTLLGREAGVALLIMMATLKVVETHRVRDVMVVIFLTYFVVNTHFFYTQSIAMVFYTAGVSVLTTAILIQLNQGSEKITVYLRLKWAGRLLLQSIPLMIVLFLLFPRLNGPIWALSNDSTTAISGLSDEMAPGSISQLIQSKRIAFRVNFNNQLPSMEKRYWRGPVLWDFDGKTWRPLTERRDNLNGSYLISGTPIRYKITLEPHNKRWLFALDMPVSLSTELNLTSDYQLLSAKPIRERSTYQLASLLNYRIDPELSVTARSYALQLPDGVGLNARKLATRWRKEGLNANAIVQKALDMFAEFPFVYTLTPPLLDKDPIDRFLFETRRGFCEHYASSFVFLMRAAKIPARVVTGYLGGEWNPLGDYMLIRQADAHAWAEVWLEDHGWVRIDPTSAVSPDRIERGVSRMINVDESVPLFVRASYGHSWLNHLSLFIDNVNYQWNRWVVAFGPEQQRVLLSKLGFKQPTWDSLVILMVSGCILIGGVYIAFFIWRDKRSNIDPLVTLYQRFGEKMAKANLRRLAHEGPMDYAGRISKTRPDLAESVMQISRLYCHKRYGNENHPQTLSTLKKLINELRC